MTATGRQLVNDYMEKYSDKDNRWIARLLFNDHPEHFSSVEDARSKVRYNKGAMGEKNLKRLQDTTFLPPDKLAEKYNLPIAIKQMDFSYLKIKTDRCLILSDIHFPFHDSTALALAIEYGVKRQVDTIILNGDILDAHCLSKFSIESVEATLETELEYTIQFIESLKKIFPDTRIYFKFGNHEKRFQRYINDNAPALRGVRKCKLEEFLEIGQHGLSYVPEWQAMDLGGITVIHGHEYSGVFRTAKALFAKTHENSACGHGHTIDNYNANSIFDKPFGSWLFGCLCDKRMPYHPYNNWDHGFGYFERYDADFWSMKSKRIIQGRIV